MKITFSYCYLIQFKKIIIICDEAIVITDQKMLLGDQCILTLFPTIVRFALS
jgi:hypothetical protein